MLAGETSVPLKASPFLPSQHCVQHSRCYLKEDGTPFEENPLGELFDVSVE